MFGWELMNILQNDPAIQQNLIDVIAIDEDWTPPTRLPACFVINTDNSDGSGQNRVSVFIDTDCSADYWELYVTPPLQQIYSWLLRQGCHPIRYNRKMIQGFTSRTCGAYCAYFCAHAGHGCSNGYDFRHISWISIRFQLFTGPYFTEKVEMTFQVIWNEWPWITNNSYSALN